MKILCRIALIAALLSFNCSVVMADCIDEAASYHSVNPYILRAIAYQESSMRSWIVHRNIDGSVDIGMLGINSVHLKELSKFGIGPSHLADPCLAAYVGAWMYRKKVQKFGNTWNAVGAYHSETPSLMSAYATKIKAIVDNWSRQGLIAK